MIKENQHTLGHILSGTEQNQNGGEFVLSLHVRIMYKISIYRKINTIQEGLKLYLNISFYKIIVLNSGLYRLDLSVKRTHMTLPLFTSISNSLPFPATNLIVARFRL